MAEPDAGAGARYLRGLIFAALDDIAQERRLAARARRLIQKSRRDWALKGRGGRYNVVDRLSWAGAPGFPVNASIDRILVALGDVPNA